VIAAAIVIGGVALGHGHWAGAGAVASAGGASRRIELVSSASLSIRSTLRRGGIDLADANAAAFALSDLIDVDHPSPDLTLDARVEPSGAGDGARIIDLVLRRADGAIATLTRAADGSIRLTRGTDAVAAAQTGVEAHEAPAVLSGPIEDVLYGDPATTSDARDILQAARLFARKLDMTADVALGDRVRLVFNRKISGDGRIIGSGDLLFAEIDTRAGPTRFYRHRQVRDGEAEFVDEAGAAFDHALLRTPLDRPRITSGFGPRLHPLLGYTRMHQGLDFGAPVGAVVVAAGDGVVEQLRWAGGYGRWIKLRHAASLETSYGHLSAWAPGLRPGASVRQGQPIGFVGSSGLSTGSHLHYEIEQAGRAVDPKTFQGIGATPMTPADRAVFDQEKQSVAALLGLAAGTPSPSPVANLEGGN
jgi:murein DD-endopeptidase MepM/ murein hydrolase activator NlpD